MGAIPGCRCDLCFSPSMSAQPLYNSVGVPCSPLGMDFQQSTHNAFDESKDAQLSQDAETVLAFLRCV